ncbi:MAG: GNAT family N-acetyltransferase [Candidatus Saccharimonadales bacterium]
MKDLKTHLPNVILVKPIPARDAKFAYEWFKSSYGKDTLLKMGNVEDEIREPSLKAELARLEDFLKLEKEGKQITWVIRSENSTIGAAWINLYESNGVKAPSIHLMIGDHSYRGRGIGKATMAAMVNYLQKTGEETVYSRHLVSNETVRALNRSFGFILDGQPYLDNDKLEWQNIMLRLPK